MIALYFAPKTCSLAVHIALEYIGIDYEAIKIDFSQQEQRKSEYLSINAKGRVPALAVDGTVITEVPAILFYLSQRFPQANLAPLDSLEASAQMQAFNAFLCSTVHVAHAHRFRGTRWVDETETDAIDAMRRKVPESMGQCMALIEEGMLKGPWVMGEQFTVADMYLYTIATWLEGDGVDISKLPRVIEHRDRMSQMPAVQGLQALYS
ncbi:MAG: glutathione S-transferase family protein [Pseudohongiellaceae bacterium]|nr:glutathione S-transferase family protein [Pseudohongiellaceae bacterium]